MTAWTRLESGDKRRGDLRWSLAAGSGVVSPLVWVSPLVLVVSVDAGSVEPDPLPVLETQIQVDGSLFVARASTTPCVWPAHEKQHVRPRIKVPLAEPGHISSWIDTPRHSGHCTKYGSYCGSGQLHNTATENRADCDNGRHRPATETATPTKKSSASS